MSVLTALGSAGAYGTWLCPLFFFFLLTHELIYKSWGWVPHSVGYTECGNVHSCGAASRNSLTAAGAICPAAAGRVLCFGALLLSSGRDNQQQRDC